MVDWHYNVEEVLFLDVGPVTVTRNMSKFSADIHRLVLLENSGGTCEEKSLSALVLALQTSLPKSTIYVFTDSHAKDQYQLNNVLQLIQETGSHVTYTPHSIPN